MAQTKLIISSKNYSAWSLRGWLLAKFSGLDFDEVPVPITDPANRAELLLLAPSIHTAHKPPMRRKFNAAHTSFHSARTFDKPRKLNCRKPRMCLIQPLGGHDRLAPPISRLCPIGAELVGHRRRVRV
jgi:hypothetical protein